MFHKDREKYWKSYEWMAECCPAMKSKTAFFSVTIQSPEK